MELWQGLRDFVYPPYCILCEAELEPENKLVCNNCWERLTPSEELESFITQDQIFSVFPYSSDMKTIIHEFKYYGKTHLAGHLGTAVGKLVLENKQLSHTDYIVPVPLHKVRFRSRGFNQSELLSEIISEVTGISFITDQLIRKRYTETQANLPVNKRAKNVEGAFKIRDENIFNKKRVLLVDDVITTGSTILECIKVLKAGGAGEVKAVTAAMA